jgi:hypothetical protein
LIDLWTTLVPLILGSAVVPVQIIITILLVQSPAGRSSAVAYVGGMTAVRLVQGLVFGLLLGTSTVDDTATEGPRLAVSLLLLVIAILMFVVALKAYLAHPDEDAPPPKWMAMIDSITPAKAFLVGLGLIAVGAKFWVFTLGAIAAIGAAQLGQPASTLAFLVFVVLVMAVHLTILAMAFLFPTRSDAVLGRLRTSLAAHNRAIMIALGLTFGIWFLLKSLVGLGIL